MNLLIIGNGFDIAHKLPTKYKDFFTYLYSCGKGASVMAGGHAICFPRELNK